MKLPEADPLALVTWPNLKLFSVSCCEGSDGLPMVTFALTAWKPRSRLPLS